MRRSACTYTLDVFVNGVRVGGSGGSLASGADSATTNFDFTP